MRTWQLGQSIDPRMLDAAGRSGRSGPADRDAQVVVMPDPHGRGNPRRRSS